MKIKEVIFIISLTFLPLSMSAQVGIGTTTPHTSSVLDLNSNSKGFLPPRMTITERDAISNPAEGLSIFNTNTNCTEIFIAGQWFNVCSGGPSPDIGPEDIYNPYTGQVFLSKNLGANQIATSPDDPASYGDLYQWGRSAEGHEVIFRVTGDAPTSGTYDADRFGFPSTATESGAWDGLFILPGRRTFTRDWLSPQDDNLWQGVSGVNNPCPAGYRVPTEAEWRLEIDSWSSNDAAGAFASPLKLPMAGVRDFRRGNVGGESNQGNYWTSTPNGIATMALNFDNTSVNIRTEERSLGFSVRCIKD